MLGFSVMVKGDSHSDKENKMRHQNSQDQRRCFLCRWVTGQQGRRGISQDQQSTGTAGHQQDNPGNKVNGNNAQDRGWQKWNHTVSVITDPLGPRQGRERHATRRQPKGSGNTKGKDSQKAPCMDQMINVVFEFFNLTAVTKRCGPVGSGL